MRDTTAIYYSIFGLLTLAGGIIGYVRAKSAPSLFAGIACALGLFLAAILMEKDLAVPALIIGLLVCISLAGKFVPDFIHKKALFPGGVMAPLSIAGIVITLMALYRR
jgi:uncharacterized membrane protein (UPF0136 family)